MLEGMAGSPSRLDLLAGGRGKTMRRDGERAVQIAGPQDLDPLALVLDQASADQRLQVHSRASLERLQVLEVDALILNAVDVVEASTVRQLLDERKLAALKLGRDAAAGPGILALGPLAGRRASAGAQAPADPPTLSVRARRGREVMELHSLAPFGPSAAPSTSSTRTRCWMVKTIPRICGLSGRTTVWCILRSPRARAVSFWFCFWPMVLFTSVILRLGWDDI